MTLWSLRTVVTPDTVKIMKIIWHFSYKSLKFPTKWFTKFCILVDPFLRNCVTISNFQYLKKYWPKKAPVLKGLREEIFADV